MKIGFVISSFTQSVPYMTYLVSNGYDVYPILLREKLICNGDEKFYLKNIIENVTKKTILNTDSLANEEKLDCMIIIENKKSPKSLRTMDYSNFLKEGAPIIISTQQIGETSSSMGLDVSKNIHIINYQPINIIDNCNVVISNLNKILQKK